MNWKSATATIAAGAAIALTACGGGDGGPEGNVAIDGSSTVYPITEAVLEEFSAANRNIRVTAGAKGTGGGFARFCRGETDINDASRPITEGEQELCEENGVDYVEIPVAYDGVTVAVNSENDWAQCITVEELRRIWQPESTIQQWSQVRDEWPERELVLYGPDTDSGTFDYFTETVVGEEAASRSDYTASADDNVLVRGVRGDVGSLGYFGFAYYIENQDELRALAVDGGSGCVEPTRETIESGKYAPMARPLFIYVKQSALQRPAVEQFVRYYLDNAPTLVPDVGYVPLSEERYRKIMQEHLGSAGAGQESAGAS
ncbi:MAG: PstS family phosphate ABC transporter substrate-binding protein [Candidatus Palauibacterales bacterium]|nr:PstS family phosphate ABC transporter substrate-binding protein [Candidatus Palauibacterales bacterium]